MTTPEEKEQPIEERIGNLIGKIFVVVLATFFVRAYWTAIAANLGRAPPCMSGKQHIEG
ncbi:MAG: hypothetical protein WAM72_11715 [Xanthobacteraceae bacterium]